MNFAQAAEFVSAPSVQVQSSQPVGQRRSSFIEISGAGSGAFRGRNNPMIMDEQAASKYAVAGHTDAADSNLRDVQSHPIRPKMDYVANAWSHTCSGADRNAAL